MINLLWLVGMFFASQWAGGVPPANVEKREIEKTAADVGIGALIGRGSPIGALVGRGSPAAAESRIVACWDAHVHTCEDAVHPRARLSMLKGSVYLHCSQTKKTICANGTMLVEACDRDGRKLAEWQFDAASLEKLKRTDRIGVGYTLCLPLDQRCLAEKNLRLTLKYCADDGKSCSDEPTRLTLRCDTPGVVQAAYIETANTTAPKVSKQTTLTDVVRLTKAGVCDEIIIRQIETTESIYDVTTEQILSLHQNGVSTLVIRTIQGRRANSSGTYTPRPILPPNTFPRY